MLDLIQTRRDLHQIPEIGLGEFKTQAYLLEVIEIDCKVRDFVQVRTWRGQVFWFYLQGSQPGAYHWLANGTLMVSILEQTGLPFSSQHQGRMLLADTIFI